MYLFIFSIRSKTKKQKDFLPASHGYFLSVFDILMLLLLAYFTNYITYNKLLLLLHNKYKITFIINIDVVVCLCGNIKANCIQ